MKNNDLVTTERSYHCAVLKISQIIYKTPVSLWMGHKAIQMVTKLKSEDIVLLEGN